MMNKFKKIFSLVLVLIMLVTALPLQSFALSLKPLSITGVEFANDNPVSMNYVQNNYGFFGGNVSLDEGYFNYNEKFYDFYVNFSDGDKVLFSEIFEQKDEITGYSGPHITVNYDECYNAILNDEETVNVYFDLNLHTENGKDIEYQCTLKKAIVPCIVKRIKPVTELPTQVYSDMDMKDAFAEAQFEVEYYGGKKEILSCGDGTDMVAPPLYFGWYETDSFCYLDAYYYHEYEEIDPLYTNVKIDDCKFADNRLKEVTCTLTKADGTTEQYTSAADINVDDWHCELGKVNGYTVELYYSDIYPTFASETEFEVNVDVGQNSDFVYYDADDVCECKICHGKGLKYIYYRIMAVIWKVFRIKEYCACGTWHWHG